ncbi:unnamed protein product [Symbiodinium sp. CCMP2592]|nr:unnamed protein product [Symbiodinium sp. CCMP2592]
MLERGQSTRAAPSQTDMRQPASSKSLLTQPCSEIDGKRAQLLSRGKCQIGQPISEFISHITGMPRHVLVRNCLHCRNLKSEVCIGPSGSSKRKPYAVTWKPISVIPPDDLLCAIWNSKGEQYFRDLFLPVDPKPYWDNLEQNAPWFREHPMFGWKGDRSKLIPVSLYGDEVAAYKATEAGSVSVIAFTTDLTPKQDPLGRYFLVSVYSDHTATSETYGDVLNGIIPRFQKLVSPGFQGFPWSSHGYQFCWSSCQGDLKWINDKYQMQPYRNNRLCSYCPCCKTHEDKSMTLGDFREGAAHTLTRYDHRHFIANTPPENRHVIFQIPGMLYERFLHDPCHGQLLGTSKVLNGAALVYLAENGWFGEWPAAGKYDAKLAPLLNVAYGRFEDWKRKCRLQCTQARFTPARLNRAKKAQFPSLSGKAVAQKVISFWLAEETASFAKRAGKSEQDEQLATCMLTYIRVLRFLDEFGMLLSEQQAAEFYKAGMSHLRIYAMLHSETTFMFQLLPKHHYFQHMIRDASQHRVNAGIYTLLAAESFVGQIGRISRRCHKATVSCRTAQRYLVQLKSRLQQPAIHATKRKREGEEMSGDRLFVSWVFYHSPPASL